MKFVAVTNDVAFRKIFSTENSVPILVSFLNAALNFSGDRAVTTVEILNTSQLPKLSNGKQTIVDVKAKDVMGNTFIVEMQVAEAAYFHKRILYYTSKSYVGQLDEGDDYGKLRPVYFIGILDFVVSQNAEYISRHRVQDVETGEQIMKDVEFVFIELPKFARSQNGLLTPIDQWTYFIKNANKLKTAPENIPDKGLALAYTQADRHNWSKAEWDDYIRAGIKAGDEKNILLLATERAEAKGLAKGIEKGKEAGEMAKAQEIAKAALAMGLSTDQIVQLTGLHPDEIARLQKD